MVRKLELHDDLPGTSIEVSVREALRAVSLLQVDDHTRACSTAPDTHLTLASFAVLCSVSSPLPCSCVRCKLWSRNTACAVRNALMQLSSTAETRARLQQAMWAARLLQQKRPSSPSGLAPQPGLLSTPAACTHSVHVHQLHLTQHVGASNLTQRARTTSQEFCAQFQRAETFYAYHWWLHKSDKIRVGDWEGADGLTRRMSYLVPYQAPRWFKRAVGAARLRALCTKERVPLLLSRLLPHPSQELQSVKARCDCTQPLSLSLSH